MSGHNNVGSVPGKDYDDYDYASHHTEPFGPGNSSGRHSPMDAFCNEPQSDKDISLGHGTMSTPESEKKHEAKMKAKLAAIEQSLPQESAQVEANQAGAEQAGAENGRAQ